MAESSDVKPADESITIHIQLQDSGSPTKLKVKRGTKCVLPLCLCTPTS
jgi:hypothetical protein